MAKSDILKNAEYMPSEVGKTIYVWSPKGGKPPADRSRSCVISAHGVESFINSKFDKPKGVNLVYYCPHGWNLAEVGIMDVATGKLKPKETIPGSVACQDYLLTKLQGKGVFEHEDYALLQHGMHRQAQEAKKRETNVLTKANVSYAKKFGGVGYYETLANDLDKKLGNVLDPMYDIVTIRDRTLYGAPTLFDVIGKLEKAGFHYGDVHCAFCRGFASGTSTGWAAGKLNV